MKVSRRKFINIQAEINEKEIKETIVKINKTKSWFFEKINKIDKTLARLIKKKKEKTNLKVRHEKRSSYNIQCRNTKDYKRFMDNYMAIKWITWKKWTNS